MTIRPLATLALAACVAAAGCAKPALTRRYSQLSPATGVSRGDVTVTASAYPIEPPSKRTIFDLSNEGQAALVTAVAARTASPSSLQEALATAIARPAAGIVDKSTFTRRVVLAVSANHQGAADRLDASTIVMKVRNPAEAMFTTWNQLATKFDVVDLGKLTFTQKDSLSYGLEGVLPGISEITKATTGGTRDRTLGEEVQLRQRYVATTGSLTPSTAIIAQQGAVGIDLVGNAVIDLTLASAKTDIERLYSTGPLYADGKPVAPDKVTLNRGLVKYAVNAAAWTLDITATFRRRAVSDGEKTITESDDTVAYDPVVGTVEPLVVVTAEDLEVSKWFLVNAACQVVHVQEHAGMIPLQFSSFDGAEAMQAWLLETGANQVSGRPLRFGAAPGAPASSATGAPAPSGNPWVGLRVEINGVNWKVPGGGCPRPTP